MTKKAAVVTVPSMGHNGVTEENQFAINDLSWLKKGDNVYINDTKNLQSRLGFTKLTDMATLDPTGGAHEIKDIQSFHMVKEAPNSFGGLIAGNDMSVYLLQVKQTLVGSPASTIYGIARTAATTVGDLMLTANASDDEDTYWQFAETHHLAPNKRYVVAAQQGYVPYEWDPTGMTYSSNEPTAINQFLPLERLHSEWEADTVYTVGDTVRRAGGGTPGYYFYASEAGTSDSSEPTWVATNGSTVTDGTVTWRTVAYPLGGVAHWAFGRLWLVDVTHTTVWFSGIGEPHKFFGISGGTLDLTQVQGFSGGIDRVIAIASYQNALIILGRENTLIYNNDPTNFALQEALTNVGCAARNTVVDVESDLVWLDKTGLRSLRRNALHPEQRLQLFSPSRHNRSALLSDWDTLKGTTAPQTPPYATYDRNLGLYVLSLESRLWVYDIKFPNEDGTFRTTTWTLAGSKEAHGITYDEINDQIVIGSDDDDIAYYAGFDDLDTDITVEWQTAWWNMDIPGKKFLKSIHYHIDGGNAEPFVPLWSIDFSGTAKTGATRTLATGIDHVKQPASGAGEFWSIGGRVTQDSAITKFYSVDLTVVKGSDEGI
jgi:hypothetical protein